MLVSLFEEHESQYPSHSSGWELHLMTGYSVPGANGASALTSLIFLKIITGKEPKTNKMSVQFMKRSLRGGKNAPVNSLKF